LKSAALLCLALVGCYDPEAVDCTVSCSAANDCASGQVCGSDGFCASPSAAGHCGGPDGGAPPSIVSLRVSIAGHGKVTIDGVGVCDSDVAHDGACMFSVRAGTTLSLVAAAAGDRDFKEWTEGCHGADVTCSLAPVMPLTQVSAKFE
jgi:hypothetical protein